MNRNYYFIFLIIMASMLNINKGITQTIPLYQLKSILLKPDFINEINDTSSLGIIQRKVNVNHVSKDFIFKHYYGQICKWETKRDNNKRQKVRFRLGDPSYVDKLEGK